jgi:phosphohistidine phosphatase
MPTSPQNKELLLLRHGKSDWNADCDDFNRPLIERGKRGAEHIGIRLQQQQLIPDFILSSPATRAIETAKKCAKAIGINERHIFQDERIYEANAASLKELLTECPAQAWRVMLVGHNPGLEHLLQDLVRLPLAETEDGKILPTATVAHLTLAPNWRQTATGCGHLNALIRASTLGDGFPFYSLAGVEFRARPAYYYNQSGVIPYSKKDGELKFLLVSTGGNKQKWTFPKGIIEPGLSPQQSAAKEAWEEAGIKGVVSDQALGSYSREKWDSLCTIQVFPMLVSEMMYSHEWEESHRQRRWVSAKEAVEVLDNPALIKMLKQLVTVLERFA